MCSLPTDAAGLLGTDFFKKAGVTIDFVCGKLSLMTSAKRPESVSFHPLKARP